MKSSPDELGTLGEIEDIHPRPVTDGVGDTGERGSDTVAKRFTPRIVSLTARQVEDNLAVQARGFQNPDDWGGERSF